MQWWKEEVDSWPLKVTFLTCEYNLPTKGHIVGCEGEKKTFSAFHKAKSLFLGKWKEFDAGFLQF